MKLLTYKDFIDIKGLQPEWGQNFSKDSDRHQVPWSDIKIWQLRTGEPFNFFFKTSYKDTEFKVMNLRASSRKRLPGPDEIVLGKAYSERFQLGDKKRKDLQSLISDKSIPSYYASYYNDILNINN